MAGGPQCPWPGPLSGVYWSARTGGHVIYESRLELARLLLADFDPVVTAIGPAVPAACAGGRPDPPSRAGFLLASADRTVRVVNVKPAARLADPAVAEAPAWPGELFVARGWGYGVWSGADPALLANIRFLAGYRRQGMPPDAVTAAVLGEVRPGERVGGLLDRLERSWRRVGARAPATALASRGPYPPESRVG